MFFILFALVATPAPELRISVSNLTAAKGKLFIGVYDRAEGFLEVEKVVWNTTLPVTRTGVMDVVVQGLRPGVYGVACFHDLNGNGKMDMNMLGIPTEPYCFSNNVRPRFRAPTWNEAKFEVGPSGKTIAIRLEKW